MGEIMQVGYVNNVQGKINQVYGIAEPRNGHKHLAREKFIKYSYKIIPDYQEKQNISLFFSLPPYP